MANTLSQDRSRAEEGDGAASEDQQVAAAAGGQDLLKTLKELQAAKSTMDVAYDVLLEYDLRVLATMCLGSATRNLSVWTNVRSAKACLVASCHTKDLLQPSHAVLRAPGIAGRCKGTGQPTCKSRLLGPMGPGPKSLRLLWPS